MQKDAVCLQIERRIFCRNFRIAEWKKNILLKIMLIAMELFLQYT